MILQIEITAKRLVIILNFFLSGILAFSQQNGAGGAVIYNFQTNGIGLDIRADIPLKSIDFLDGISIVPQLAYFPPISKIHEFYIGSSAHLGVYTLNKWKFYVLGNLSYDGWINYENSGKKNAKFSNLGLEGGLGITSKKCIRPFMEIRYNVKWKEANVRLGLIYTIKCERRGAVPCPKIPPPPKLD
jgi:hypothetical protein